MSRLNSVRRTVARNFNESEHLRDSRGRFTSKNNSESSNKIKAIGKVIKSEKQEYIPILPKDRSIFGNHALTKDELIYTNIKPDAEGNVKLTSKDVDNINLIRNNYNSRKEMLDDDPDFSQPIIIYSGDRVRMGVGEEGNVEFTVDNNFTIDTRDNFDVPSSELRNMTRAWLEFKNSKAGQRLFWNQPSEEDEGKNRYEARVKMYKKYGFDYPTKEHENWNVMVFNNNAKFKDPANEAIKQAMTEEEYNEFDDAFN